MAKTKPKTKSKPWFSKERKEDIGRMLQSLAVAAIIGFVSYASGHLVLSNFEAIVLFFSIVALTMIVILLKE